MVKVFQVRYNKRNKRIKAVDWAAKWIIIIGGIMTIGCIMAIFVLIINTTLPLFRSTKSELLAQVPLSNNDQQSGMAAFLLDERLKSVCLIYSNGHSVAMPLVPSMEQQIIEIPRPSLASETLRFVDRWGSGYFSLLWNDGMVNVVSMTASDPADLKDQNFFTVKNMATLAAPQDFTNPDGSIGRVSEDGRATRVDWRKSGELHIYQECVQKNILGKETRNVYRQKIEAQDTGAISSTVMDHAGNVVYMGTENGELLLWDLREAGKAVLQSRVKAASSPIKALALIFGEISVAVGDAEGAINTWSLVRDSHDETVRHLRRTHAFAPCGHAIQTIAPSMRDKCFLALNISGEAVLGHMTSERRLLALHPDAPLRWVTLSARGNGMAGVDADNKLSVWQITNPHPEISWRTLFGKVWYESYDEPVYAWQSSSANDDFEPKFSLVPLLFGSIKGSVYAMALAVPLALLGAMYVSQFATHRFRKIIKPAIETMASVPSVVVGFLAALWFAPLLEHNIAGFFLALVFIPAAILAFILAWHFQRGSAFAKRVEQGYEFLVIVPVIAAGALLAFYAGPFCEQMLFGGTFKQWLFDTAGRQYDQRNCIVIAFGLGFAVIPIIFTIAEDALTNIPQSLKAASLALGASRWQTTWRVVLPSASPGVLAAIIIGLGRAIGETMIVLMATGNTPIMDWSMFNGMRTLSANIAVEIPEAPVGGTLYRVLFLSAVLLFLLTSILNTVAELVRQRLRKKYGHY